MPKDYAKKYIKYKYLAPRRKKNAPLWMMLGISVGLFILGLFFFKSFHKEKAIQPIDKIINKKNIEAPAPHLPEPKFDFYNILPQENLNNSPRVDAMKEMPLPNNMAFIHPSIERSPLDAMLSPTPEQVAIAEAKKQLEEEMGQVNNEAYILVLGNFTERVRAEQLQAQALLKGFPVKKKVNLFNGQSMYQIFMGPADLSELIQEKKRLNAVGLEAVLFKTTP